MTKKDIKRAAYRLKQWSDVLIESCKNGGTESKAASVEAAEMADLSKKLYAMAKEPRQSSMKI